MRHSFTYDNGNKLLSRGCDPQGCGHYGAPRDGGTRKHKGHDFEIEPNTPIFTPFPCKIIREGIVSVNKPFKLIELTPLGIFKNIIKIKVMYAHTGSNNPNYEVPKGYPIGISEDVGNYYGGGMKNHIHVEVRVYGQLIDPKLIFRT